MVNMYLEFLQVAQATTQEVQFQLVESSCWVLEDHREQCSGMTGMVEDWVDEVLMTDVWRTVEISIADEWRADLTMTEGLWMVQGDG